ncbi:MAG: DUF72 domain-containing protein [Nitriliruptorales bacterium]|nr:DUF72 domain-containing protein [Nitriliruptorales bacterium]
MDPRRQPTIRVGTASWTDPTLLKETDWYPKRSMSAEARLRFYASIFTVVEVDATYYHPPTEELAALWVDRTPQDFRFDIKAYSLLTQHPTQPKSLWDDVAEQVPDEHAGAKAVYLSHLPDQAVDEAFERFRIALMPLHSAGKLGAVFFQFPQWFTARRDNRAYLQSLAERLADYQIAVEFRHGSWMDADTAPRTLQLLESAGLAYVSVDEPQGFKSSVPPVVAATADLAVLRMHGHNRENWQRKGITAAERFRYLYSDKELQSWAPKVRELAGGSRETHVLFNNCYRDYGVRNARQLGELLDDGLQDRPAE